MTRYPSNRTLTDQIFFITTGTKDRRLIFAQANAAQTAIDSLQFFRNRGEIRLFGFVIMPDHVHFVLRVNLPLTISKFVKRFKTHVAHVLGLGPIWEHSFWSETIDTEHLLYQKLTYIHNNPVRAGLVEEAKDFSWSSAAEYLVKPQFELIDPLY